MCDSLKDLIVKVRVLHTNLDDLFGTRFWVILFAAISVVLGVENPGVDPDLQHTKKPNLGRSVSPTRQNGGTGIFY